MVKKRNPKAYTMGECVDYIFAQHVDLSWIWSWNSEWVRIMRYTLPELIPVWVVDHQPEILNQIFILNCWAAFKSGAMEKTLDDYPDFAKDVAALAALRKKTAEFVANGIFRDRDGLKIEGDAEAFIYQSSTGIAVAVADIKNKQSQIKLTVDLNKFNFKELENPVLYTDDGKEVNRGHIDKNIAELTLELNPFDVAVWVLSEKAKTKNSVHGCKTDKKTESAFKHLVVAGEKGKFFGWPANNGLWTWDGDREILVGFSYGNFVEQNGHNIEGVSEHTEGILSLLARSKDGGCTWTIENPENYVGDGGEVTPSPGGLPFDHTDFAMRTVGIGYHGAKDSEGRFFFSINRGKTWRGPFSFGSLMNDPNLVEMQFTGRTRYLTTGPDSCLIFLSARPKVNGGGRDKSFVAETVDGGKTFQFISWIVSLDDPYRAVMPAVVKLTDGTLIAALRRKNVEKDLNWIDCYGSWDNGSTWSFLSRAGETGDDHNGNPPALTITRDEKLVCAYGDRTRSKMFARLSADGGKTWDKEIILRDDFQPDSFDDKDFGYAQLTQNHQGELVAMYYWSTKNNLQHHIAATIWKAK